MEKYFRADVNETNIVIDLNYNEEEHTFVIKEDFEDSWTDVVIEGKDKTVNVYIDDTTDDFKMTIYTEIDGHLSDDEIIKCDGYDLPPNVTLKEILETPQTDFIMEFTVEQLEKLLANKRANNIYSIYRNVDAPQPEYHIINIKIKK